MERHVTHLGELNPDRQAVAQMVAAGLTNKEIAHRRGATVQTVKNMLSDTYRQTGTTNRVELTVWVLRWRVNAELRKVRYRMVREGGGGRPLPCPYIRVDAAMDVARRVLVSAYRGELEEVRRA